jgi:phenylalanyl-tRNA synthetase beta chain
VQKGRRTAREALVGAGLSEAWSTSLLAPADLARAGLGTEAVEVENPLAQEESVLRTSLLPGLLRAVVTNAHRRYPSVRLFEIGKVFVPPAAGERLPAEPELVAGALAGADAAEAKRVLDTLVAALAVDRVSVEPASQAGMHPSRSATVSASGELVGVVGEVDPGVLAAHGLDGPVGWFELELEALLAAPTRSTQYRPVSRYPSADFDLAVVVDDAVAAAAVADALAGAAGDLLEDLWLFDVFRGPQLGEGRRSLAYRVRVAAPDRTLDEDELSALRERAIAALTAVGGTLRT